MSSFQIFTGFSLFFTALSPYGSILTVFQDELNNQLAEEVVLEHAQADINATIAAAEEMQKLAKEKKKECDENAKEYETRKIAGDPTYDFFYENAFGRRMENEPENRWANTPLDQRPACPAYAGYKAQAAIETEAALTAKRNAKADFQANWSDNYVGYLEAKHPTLYEGNFKKTHWGKTRIKSGKKEANEAMTLLASGQRAPLLGTVTLTFISLFSSLAAVILTYHFARHPQVRHSWKTWTLVKKNQLNQEQEVSK